MTAIACKGDEDEMASTPFVCGTRRVMLRRAGDWRVVCATCLSGGTVRHDTAEAAQRAAVRDSARPCLQCGAS